MGAGGIGATARRVVLVALAALPALPAADASAQDQRYTRPDRWFITSSSEGVGREATPRMLYLGRDGTVLIVQCAARDGARTGGWSFMIRRDDWSFRNEFLEGWWTVDDEELVGPLRWGGSGPMVVLNEDALRDRLRRPVERGIRLRVVHGAREWSLELDARDLAPAVERFAPTCEAA